MSKEVNLFDYLCVVVKWRKFIFINFLVVCLLAAGISLILPKWYTASTTILPPEEQPFSLGLPSMLANFSLGGASLPGLSTPGAIYVAILESRTVREAVIDKLDLVDVYKAETMEEAVEKLGRKTDITISDQGVIELTATARTPQQSADIANALIEELDRKNMELSIAQAKHNRQFVEGRLAENKEALRQAEEELRRFQEKHKAISLTEQTAAAIEAAAAVIGEMRTLEVKRDVLLTTMKPGNPSVIQVQAEIDALQRQLDRMAFGSDEATPEGEEEESSSQFYVPFSEVPSVGLELARLLRELKIQEAIFELLTQQHEQAKIQEAKDTPTVQIIDPAVPPEIRSRPVRSVIVLFSGGLSLILSLMWIAGAEYISTLRIRNPEEYNRLHGVARVLREDAARILRKAGLKKKRRPQT